MGVGRFATPAGRAGSAIEAWVGGADVISGDPGVSICDDVIVGSIGEFGGYAEPSVGGIEVA